MRLKKITDIQNLTPCNDRWVIFQSCLSMGPDWYLACLLPICQHQIPWAWGCVLADSFTLDLQQLPCVITLQLSVHNEVLSDSWLGAKADNLKRAPLSKLYNTWPRGDEFTDWRLGCNPVFWRCQCPVFACVFRFHGLSYRSVPTLPLSGLLTLSPRSTTPLRLPGTTPLGCYPLSRFPLTSSQPSHAEGRDTQCL